MTYRKSSTFNPPTAFLLVLLTLAVCMSPPALAQVGLDLVEDLIAPTNDLLDPGRPTTTFKIKVLVVDSNSEYALVSYSQKTDDGPTQNQLGWIFLSNDRKINYKMGMITLKGDI